jgi:hypothetical protein
MYLHENLLGLGKAKEILLGSWILDKILDRYNLKHVSQNDDDDGNNNNLALKVKFLVSILQETDEKTNLTAKCFLYMLMILTSCKSK